MNSNVKKSTYITKLEISNFKSFGLKTSLKLEEGLNIITGPNGSGKSNILDAIRFCMGENSPKSLRVNKQKFLKSDIPESSNKRTRVLITIDNVNRLISVDSDTVTVSRELKESGESSYFLNGRRVRRDTILKLLDVATISSTGLNIIPQGMITRISELSPDEKRRLIENVIGVSQFDEKKSEAENQLKEADLRLQVALARIGEIKDRVDSLEGERNDQLRLKHLEKEMNWLKSVILSKNLESVKDKIFDQNDLVEKCSNKLNELKSKREKIENQIKSLEQERSDFLSSVLDESGSEHLELQFAIAKLSNEIDRLRTEIEENEITVNRIDDTLPILYKMHDEKLKELGVAEKEVGQLAENLSELNKDKDDTIKELVKIQDRKKRLDTFLSKVNPRYERLKQRIMKKKETVEILSTRIAELEIQKSETSEKLDTLKGKSKSFLDTLSQLKKNLSELQHLKEIEQESLHKVNASLTLLSDQRIRLVREITKAMSTLDKASGAVLKYEAQSSIVETVASYESNFRKLKELAEAGAIGGFIGKLEDLINYEKRYEQAILASAGKWMKAIILKNLNVMLKIAETAKRLKMSRLLIIPLSEVSNIDPITPPPIEGSLGTISDFISTTKDLDDAVNFIFGGTILVSSNKAAFFASSKGYRAVTLNGDIFEPKGSAFETGYIVKLDNLFDLIRDETSFSEVKKASNSLKNIIAKRKSHLKKLNKQSTKLNKKKIKKSLMLERLTTQLTNIKNFLKKYRRLQLTICKKIQKLENKLKRQEKKINRFLSTRTDGFRKIEEYEKKISELNIQSLNEEIIHIDEKKKSFNDLLENFSSQICELITLLTKDKANLENILRPNCERLIKQISQLEKEREEKVISLKEDRLNLKKISENFEELKSKESYLIEANRKSKPILEDYENRLKEIHNARDGCLRSINRIEKEIFFAKKNLESSSETEQRILNELSSLGYCEPSETFDSAEKILSQISLEYSRLKNSVNLLANRNYQEIITSYKNISVRKNQLESERNAIVRFIERVEAEKKHVFISSFEKIDRELRSIFNDLTGGSAWLEIEDSSDIFSSGIFLMTQFPGKTPRESTSISGGEKTVTALAFILSIQSVYPSLFYLFDEIDAHLDAINLEKLADLLKKRSMNSQIILITLKPSMIARSSATYGVYNKNGLSRVVRYKPKVEVMVRSG
ncbi:MAG: chromosome segregation protein SMC [Candidatus Methylarchaceae archaeon HK02M2]|nr:chromosome segregation protein SMC [Candidatus Methylarchaceae archaeon HK02M2]